MKIKVHFDLNSANPTGDVKIVDTKDVHDLLNAILHEFPDTLSACREAHQLVVRVGRSPTANLLGEQDLRQKLWQMPLFDAETLEPLEVYVEVPKKQIIAGHKRPLQPVIGADRKSVV